MTTTVLKGAALTQRARDLSIPGRSRMSADELRAAIDSHGRGYVVPASPGPVTVYCKICDTSLTGGGLCWVCNESGIDAVFAPVPAQVPDQVPTRQGKINSVHPVTPFRARNGKHKPSARHTCRRVR